MLERQEEADRTVFVGNLDGGVREEILYELFLQAGPLTKVTIAKDKEGNLKSFGFVCFKHPESVPYAIALLNGIRLFGRPIRLHYRVGSSYSGDPSPVCQGPENGFVPNQVDYGVPVMGEPYLPGFPMPSVATNHLSEAYYYYSGMMNQFLAFQRPPLAVAAPEPPPRRTAPSWGQEPFPPYDDGAEYCGAGPSSQRLNSCDRKSKTKASKRQREAESSGAESSGDNRETQKSTSGRKVKKRKKSKRRKM